jgi:hypothetical protein
MGAVSFFLNYALKIGLKPAATQEISKEGKDTKI